MGGDNDIEMGSADVNLEEYRLISSYITALFWADKACSLSNNDAGDVYMLGRCMYNLRQYRRAVLFIQKTGLDKTDIYCRYMTVKCLIAVKEFSEAKSLLCNEDLDDKKSISTSKCYENAESDTIRSLFNVPESECSSVSSALLSLMGQVYEALDDRIQAALCYKKALSCDINCYDALNSLIEHHLLTCAEAQKLLEYIINLDTCSDGENAVTKPIYQMLLKSYIGDCLDTNITSLPLPRCLEKNTDVLAADAVKLYSNCNYKECYELTETIRKRDPYHTMGLMTNISCLVELGYKNKLFSLAHDLVDVHPDSAIAWLAVGCYYYLTGKQDPARRYLSKATLVDGLFGPAMLAYGHSFAVDNEHDQAMAAYFKAAQLMKGSHLPLLYIGLECGLTSNIGVAFKFFQEARLLAPRDPFVIHEMGVIAFQSHKYDKAEHYFLETQARLKEINEPLIAVKWEALFNNLGHVARKLKKYDKALEYHQQALLYSPLNASTLTCIGLIHSLCGNLPEAIQALHKSLGIRRNDSFSTTLLNYVIDQSAENEEPFEGSDLINTITISTGDTKPKQKKSVWTQNPEGSNTYEENDFVSSDNDPNYSLDMKMYNVSN